MWNYEKVNEALFFAMKAHENQKMKYPSDVPYSAHIFGVALTALNYIQDENVDQTLVLLIALLHDTLEDTAVKYDDLKEKFGTKVADGVLALTKNAKIDKEKQMEDCLNRILSLNVKEVAIVKLADRCFNTRNKVETWTKEKQQNYVSEAKLICDKIGFYSEPLKNKILENINAENMD